MLFAALQAFEAVLEAVGAILAAYVASQVRPGSRLVPSWTLCWGAPGACLGADRASERGGGACSGVRTGEGGALERLKKPYQAALGIPPRLTVPWGHGGGLTENGECLHDLNVFAPAFKASREEAASEETEGLQSACTQRKEQGRQACTGL